VDRAKYRGIILRYFRPGIALTIEFILGYKDERVDGGYDRMFSCRLQTAGDLAWDGTGYPHGLKGEQIPLAARLFAVADVWDALRSDRPYRKAWSEKKVLEYIHSLAGTHFDPMAVECLPLT